MSKYLTVKEVVMLLNGKRSETWMYQHKREIPGFFELAGSYFFDADVLQCALKQRALNKKASRPKGFGDNRHNL